MTLDQQHVVRAHIGRTVKVLRLAGNESRASLAARTGLTPKRIYLIDEGRARLRASELEALTLAFPALAELLKPKRTPAGRVVDGKYVPPPMERPARR